MLLVLLSHTSGFPEIGTLVSESVVFISRSLIRTDRSLATSYGTGITMWLKVMANLNRKLAKSSEMTNDPGSLTSDLAQGFTGT